MRRVHFATLNQDLSKIWNNRRVVKFKSIDTFQCKLTLKNICFLSKIHDTMIRNQKCASNSFLYYIGIFHLRRIEYYQTNYEEKRLFTSRLIEACGNGRSANQ